MKYFIHFMLNGAPRRQFRGLISFILHFCEYIFWITEYMHIAIMMSAFLFNNYYTFIRELYMSDFKLYTYITQAQ